MAMEPIKLSEVENSQMLVVRVGSQDGVVMTKEDFLQSEEYLDRLEGLKVYIGEKEVETFDLYNVFENMEDDKYEDWIQDVWPKIEKAVDVAAIEKAINDVMEQHPTYWDGRCVDIDN